MVKKVSGVGTVKMFLVMFIVFVFSFLLTVNVFAADDEEEKTWDIENPNYYGTYLSNTHSVGYVDANQDNITFNVYLHVYTPSSSDLISGVSKDGALTSRDYGFTLPNYTIVDHEGNIVGRRNQNVTVTGKTEVVKGGFLNRQIKSVTLIPTYMNLVKYKLTK